MTASEPRATVVARLWRFLRKNRGAVLMMTLLIPVVIAWGLPLLLMISTSLKTQAQLRSPTVLIPDPIAWGNYPRSFSDFLPFGLYFKNSLVISVLAVLGDVLSSAFIAYGFAKFRFPGRDFLFVVLLGTMMIPFAVRMIPLLYLYREIGWINTILPLVVPSFFGTNAMFVFLAREFFKGIPDSLFEVARIEGANELQIWSRIALPLCKPVLAVIALLAFQQSWNDFLPHLVFLTDPEKFTVSLGLLSLIGGNDAAQPWQYLMAATVITSAPMVLLFVVAQRYFISGVTVSGVKG